MSLRLQVPGLLGPDIMQRPAQGFVPLISALSLHALFVFFFVRASFVRIMPEVCPFLSLFDPTQLDPLVPPGLLLPLRRDDVLRLPRRLLLPIRIEHLLLLPRWAILPLV